MRLRWRPLAVVWISLVLVQSVPLNLSPNFPVSMGVNERMPSLLQTEVRASTAQSLGIVSEFPTPEHCGDDKAWEKVALLKKDSEADKSLSYHKIVSDKALMEKYFKCPMVDLSNPDKPVFQTCCAHGQVSLSYVCVTVDDAAAAKLKPSLDKWLAALKKPLTGGAKPPHPSEFIHTSCPPKLGMLGIDTPEKVCASKFDCTGIRVPASKGDTKVVDAHCCWSAVRNAPGFCSQSCGVSTYEVLARCDVESDCHAVGSLQGHVNGLVCCHDSESALRSDERRGFCAESCGDSQEVVNGCGANNKCTVGSRKTVAQIVTAPKCCQSMKPSMANLPARSCQAQCQPSEEDITGLTTPDHIAVMMSKPDEDAGKEDEISRGRQMQRFAQISARALENPLEFQKVLNLAKRTQLVDQCTLVQAIIPPMARHILNSVLMTFSPFLVLDTVTSWKADPVKTAEQLGKNFLHIKDLNADEQLKRLLNLHGADAEFSAVANLLRKFESAPADVRKMENGAQWWETQNQLFSDAVDAALSLCNAAIVDAGAGTPNDPDYMAMFRFMRDPDFYRASVKDWDTPKRIDAFERARVCYSVWTRARSGLFYYSHTLAKENDKSMAMLSTAMKFMTGIGTAITPLTFGLGGVVTSAIEFVVGKTAGADREKQRIAVGTITNLFEETMAEIPESLQRQCEQSWSSHADKATYQFICGENGLSSDIRQQVSFICSKHIEPIQTQLKAIEESIAGSKTSKDEIAAQVAELEKQIEAKTPKPQAAPQPPTPSTAPKEPAASAPQQPRPKKVSVWDRLYAEAASHGRYASTHADHPSKPAAHADPNAAPGAQTRRPATAGGAQKSTTATGTQRPTTPTPTPTPTATDPAVEELAALRDKLAHARSMLHVQQQFVLDRELRLSEGQRNLQYLLQSVYKEYFNTCVFNLALDSHFEAIKIVYKQLTSIHYCRATDAWEPKGYFMEKVVGLTPAQQKLVRVYKGMLDESTLFSIIQTLGGVTQNAGLANQLYIKEQKWMSTDISTAPMYAERIAHASHNAALFGLDVVNSLASKLKR